MLKHELGQAAAALPVAVLALENIGEYAGRVFDYHCANPQLSRLLHGEGLVMSDSVTDESERSAYYAEKVAALNLCQQQGYIAAGIDCDHLMFMILALACWLVSNRHTLKALQPENLNEPRFLNDTGISLSIIYLNRIS